MELRIQKTIDVQNSDNVNISGIAAFSKFCRESLAIFTSTNTSLGELSIQFLHYEINTWSNTSVQQVFYQQQNSKFHIRRHETYDKNTSCQVVNRQ